LSRFREDGIEFRSALSNKILLAIASICENEGRQVHGIEKERIFEALDPEEEAEFRRRLETIRTGSDDEAFYRETKAGYLSGQYRDEKAEITNNIAVAEKMVNTEEIERLAVRLMELEQLIKNTMEDN
jgi:hypothetical protein